MSQHDMEITTADANTGITVRAAINAALQALISNSSGATEPTVMYAYQLWADTTAGLLKIRNAANTAWITIGTLASINLGLATVTALDLKAPIASPTFTGVVTVPAPVNATDAATKSYADAVASGLDVKDSVRLATAAALPACTAAGSGIGKTLTASAVGILTVDGVNTVLNNRILVKNQVAGVDNGIYKVTTEGTSTVAFVLTRAVDADESVEVTAGMFTFAVEGTVNGDYGLVLTTNDPITLDTTALTFTIFSSAGAGVTNVTGTSPIASSGGFTPAISLLGTVADKILYTTGINTWAEAAITAAGRAILDDVDAAAQATTLGLGVSNSPVFAGLGVTGPLSQSYGKDTQSMMLHTKDFISDTVISGLLPATSTTLTSDISAGVAYSQGRRIVKATTSKTYTASKDTYLDLRGDGTYIFTEVLNAAAAPAIATDSIRLAKVVTDATAITSVGDLRQLHKIFVTPTGNLEISGRVFQSGLGFSTFFGYQAGYSDDLTNNYNTAIGYQALFSNTIGYDNTASGVSALYSNTTGYSNSASGYLALYSNTFGGGNSAMGSHALYSNTGGGQNSAMGMRVLYSNNGNNNSAVGYETLYVNTTGNYNSAMGSFALRLNTTGSGSSAMGYLALSSNTTGSGNIAFGYGAGDNITTGNRNIIIGYDIDAPSATGNYQLNIGNLIFGTNLDGIGAIISTGGVGIGKVPTPGVKLDVGGSISQDYGFDTHTMLLHTKDFFSDTVISGCLPVTSTTLTSDISAGIAYSQGRRIVKPATSKTYTASKDTYLDLKGDGTYIFTEVLNAAAAPAIAADSIRLAKVVTDAAAITSVTDLRQMHKIFVDSFGNVGIKVVQPTCNIDTGSMRLRQTLDIPTTAAMIEFSDRQTGWAQGFTWNAYYDGANWKHRNTDYTALLTFLATGELVIYTGPSLAADSAPTWSEKLRLTNIGNLSLGGTVDRATTVGTKVLNIFDGTAPAGTLAAGCSIYSTTGELYTMDAGGTATLQTPHDSSTGEWIFFSQNITTGKSLRIKMEKIIKKLDGLLGGGYVEENG